MNANSSHRALFFSAAVWNFLAGLPLMVATVPFTDLMGLPLNTPAAVLFTQLTALAVIGFGGAYWMAGRDPVHYRPFIWFGLILKLCLAGLIYGYWLSDQIPWPLPLTATVDVVFAVLFWRYLRTHPMPPNALQIA